MFSFTVGGKGFACGGVSGFLDDLIVVNVVAEFGEVERRGVISGIVEAGGVAEVGV